MNIMTTVLYWISSGLLIPVVVFLLIMFLRSLLLIGGMYGTYSGRVRFKKSLDTLISHILERDGDDSRFPAGNNIAGNASFSAALKKMQGLRWERVHGEKIISDYETEVEKKMGTARMLVRLGPMLGLMGTLIPMGPALVSLGAGDISSMAVNMQVAFSTTVVGIFIGGIGFLANQLQNRWYSDDLNNLDYLLNLMNRTCSVDAFGAEEEVCYDVETTTA